MRRLLALFITLAMILSLAACGQPQAEDTESTENTDTAETAAEEPAGETAEESDGGQMVFGYITPGPDTWYLRDVEGFQAAAELLERNRSRAKEARRHR